MSEWKGPMLPGTDLPDIRFMDIYAYVDRQFCREAEDFYVHAIKPGEEDNPKHTLEEEIRLMNEQVKRTKGFNMEFDMFSYIFNYQPVDFDDNEAVSEPDTTRELLDRLSRESLEEYNKIEATKYEYVKVIKANYHMDIGSAVMYYITYEGKDPSNDETKYFQAKVYSSYHDPPTYLYCAPKPEEKNVHRIESAEKEDAKKARLMTQEISKGGETQALL